MSDLSIIEQCLLTSDAPESVWRPALESIQADMIQSHRDNVSAFDLLSRVRMALGDNGKRMQDELIEYCKGLVGRVDELETAIHYHRESLTSGRTVCDQVLWTHVSREPAVKP